MLRILLGLFAATTLLTSCGGSHDGAHQPSDGNTEVRATIITRVDPDRTTTPAGDTVATVLSPFDSAKTGQKLITSSNAVASAPLLIGVDTQGQSKLLKYEDGDGALSADTTLFALVRLGINTADLPADMATSAPLGQIRKSASYTAGLVALRAALASSTAAPLQSQAVIDSVADIVSDAIRLAARPPGAAMNLAAASSTLTPIPVAALPYYFWKNANIDKAWLADDAGLSFKNRTFVAWHLTTATGSALVGEVNAPPLKQTTLQLIGDYAGSESSTPLKEPPERFTVTLDQTRATQLMNAQMIVTKSAYAILEVGLGAAKLDPSRIQKCTLDVSETIMADEKFAAIMTDFSAAAVTDFLWDKKFDLFNSVLANCTKDGEDADNAIKNIVTRLTNADWQSHLNIFYKSLKAARSATAAYGSVSQFMKYGSQLPITVELCRYNSTISPCIARLEAASPIEMGIGETADLNIRAYDSAGNMLPTLPSLTVTSDQANVAQPALAGYQVKGLAAGEAQLSVVDAISGRNTTIRVVVHATTPPFSSTVKLSGPAELTGLNCSGTYTISADATLAAEGETLRLRLLGNEDIALSCYHQNTPSDMSVSLVKSGNSYKGSVNLPFTCAPPCNTGSTTFSADLVLTGSGAEQGLSGALVVINENKTPFYARAEGNVRLHLP